MHSAKLVSIILFLAWNSSALPCDDSLIPGEAYDVSGISQPDEVILVTFSEGDDGDEGVYAEPVLTSSDDIDADGEVVESAANDDAASQPDDCEPSDPVSTGDSGSENQEVLPDIEDSDVVVTTDGGAKAEK